MPSLDEGMTNNQNDGAKDTPGFRIKRIPCRVLPGILNQDNRNSLDWGWQNLAAFGCQNVVVIIDPVNMLALQTLSSKRKSSIIQVKWQRENYAHYRERPYGLKLAACDSAGNIEIWDAKGGNSLFVLSDGNKAVADMEWMNVPDQPHDLLAALHPPYNLIIWNATTGTKIWKKSYTESLVSFVFDPFDMSRLSFLAQDCILFIDDFTLDKVPSGNGRKFYVSGTMPVAPTARAGDRSSAPATLDLNNTLTNVTQIPEVTVGSTSTKYRIKNVFSIIGGSDNKSAGKSTGDNNISIVDCLQLAYHKACRNLLLLLYPREVLIIDLEINQTLGIIALERNGAPFTQIIPCWQRDSLYCLHDNGSVTWHTLRRKAVGTTVRSPTSCSDLPDINLDLTYDLKCQSDAVRVTKHSRVCAFALNQVNECQLVLLMTDGRLLLLELNSNSTAHTQGKSICDYVPPTFSSIPSPPKTDYSFLFSGILFAVNAPPFVIRMCPPLTTKNVGFYEPLLAVGGVSGSVQVVNVSSGLVKSEINIHSCPIRGVEWVSLCSFLSFGYNVTNSNSQVRNELYVTDINSGESVQLRTESKEESPIDAIKVSHLKLYFVLMFKDDPMEIWDQSTYTILKILPKKFPLITAFEWSPLTSSRQKKKLVDCGDSLSIESNLQDFTLVEGKSAAASQPKENFVLTDNESQLYCFTIEGNRIKDGSKFPTNSAGSVTCMAWKAEDLVQGDADGNLTFWDLKQKVCKTVSTRRGWIKKLKFAPGRSHMKLLVLYNDGVDIWDVNEMEVQGQLKCPRDLSKVIDIEWAASDRPILATADGCIRIMTIDLNGWTGPVRNIDELDELFFCPHLLGTKAALNLRSVMQSQLWKGDDEGAYSLDALNEEDGFSTKDDLLAVCRIIDSSETVVKLSNAKGTVERCLLTARFFGDEFELQFWTVAQYYLKMYSQKELVNSDGSVSELDTGYDHLCSNNLFQMMHSERVLLQDCKQSTADRFSRSVDTHLLLGNNDRAIKLLLETEPSSDSFYIDCLRACLVSCIQTSGENQLSTVKLVATNLIASGKIKEGVQLLCLIGKVADACRYLQSHGQWVKAAWLSKVRLDRADSTEVWKRWVEHLCSSNLKNKALLVLLTCGQFEKVAEMLFTLKRRERGALFIHACLEHQLWPSSKEADAIKEALLLDYARYLFSVGNTKASLFYCDLVNNQRGLRVKEELLNS